MTRVLVVEDESDIRLLMHVALTGAGYTVEEASDGQRALDRFERGGLDLVVLDLRLPVLDGWQVMERSRAAGRPLPPILAVSAHADPALMHQAVTSGAVAYLAKPFLIPAFLEAVASALTPR